MAKARNRMVLSSLTARDEWEESYNGFIDELFSGNVILMIGKAFSLNVLAIDEVTNEFIYRDFATQNNSVPSVYDYILDILNYNYGSDAQSLNDLSYDDRFINKETKNNINIYSEIRRVIDKAEFSINDVNPLLIKLINTGLFKFVVTTSFDPLVEIAMKEKWGEGLRVLSVSDTDIDCRDIKDEFDFTHPCLYYLFGSATKKNQKFVVTDNDALDMISFWQSSMASSNLIKNISEKNILTLGCDYDDWLFRFIWHMLRKRANNQKERSCVADFNISPKLEHYLKQHNVLIQKEIDEFVQRVLMEVHNSTQSLSTIPQKSVDIFISYSRADKSFAQAIYRKLCDKGFSVWFDLFNLGGKGKQYMEEIYRTIDNSKWFIPILSPNIKKQTKEFHPYRLEWDRASKQQIGRGVNYCRPICIGGFDINSAWKNGDIPMWLNDLDCWNIVGDNSLEDFINSINH